MAIRRWNKLAILHKLETTYGTDPTPAAGNAIVAKNVTFTPMEGEEVSRDLMLPYMGNQGTAVAGEYGRIEFDVELAGSGTAGTPPKFGSLLRAAGMAETISAGVSVEYTIVEDAVESSAIHFITDKVRHIFVGGQANIAINYVPKAYPHIRVTYQGFLGTITDVGTMPAVSLTGWATPRLVSKANTILILHGWTSVAESLSLDLGNVLAPRHLIGDERMMISDRRSTGNAVVEGRALSEINWFNISRSRARGALSVVHGLTAGNIATVTAPAVEVGRVSQGQTNNIVNYSLSLALCPVAGMDEMKIAFT